MVLSITHANNKHVNQIEWSALEDIQSNVCYYYCMVILRQHHPALYCEEHVLLTSTILQHIGPAYTQNMSHLLLDSVQ